MLIAASELGHKNFFYTNWSWLQKLHANSVSVKRKGINNIII